MATGTVKWYDPDKGFGFIAREGGDDLFVHRTALSGEVLAEGDIVEFDLGVGMKGAKAENVRIIERGAGVPRAARSSGSYGSRGDRPARFNDRPAVDPSTLPLATGVVRRYDAEKGFGFIAQDSGGEDVFVHRSAAPYGGLNPGDRVEFRLGHGPKGARAEEVRRLDDTGEAGDAYDY